MCCFVNEPWCAKFLWPNNKLMCYNDIEYTQTEACIHVTAQLAHYQMSAFSRPVYPWENIKHQYTDNPVRHVHLDTVQSTQCGIRARWISKSAHRHVSSWDVHVLEIALHTWMCATYWCICADKCDSRERAGRGCGGGVAGRIHSRTECVFAARLRALPRPMCKCATARRRLECEALFTSMLILRHEAWHPGNRSSKSHPKSP